MTAIVFVNECPVDGCYKKQAKGAGGLCRKHYEDIQDGKELKAFYGKTIKKIAEVKR